jgi:hypothetical protein
MPRKSLNEGHGFTGCRKLMFCITPRLYRLRKNSCFVSGHDFSRAIND